MITLSISDTGLSAKSIESIQSVFARYPEIEKAILYGSRAKGNFRKGSDIDLTLEGRLLTLTMLNQIHTELDELLLPYQIDISIRHKIKNADLLNHIDRVGKLFYEKE
ncbi:MAG: nucleotidyltransferase domain-containing protein [Cyclobacterium sp.]|uniref:nucleotidyltransferase domain-containing protein n=1 Tax=unclassified Cyclobacterium TaxID=2615055 RepID=UPI0013D4288B|nr:nucleotidyltransferase domain-containing protein [Cyclobacterium sp. SYSU L10401]